MARIVFVAISLIEIVVVCGFTYTGPRSEVAALYVSNPSHIICEMIENEGIHSDHDWAIQQELKLRGGTC